MQRERNNAVTHVPILIATSRSLEGFVAIEDKIKAARVFRNDDLRGASTAMKEHEAMHFAAVTMLGRALSQNLDLLAVKKAVQLLKESHLLEMREAQSEGDALSPFPEAEDSAREEASFASALTALSAVAPGQTLKALFSKKVVKADPRWLLSREVSKAIAQAKLVFWWNGLTFKPAVWCPDLKTAFYTSAFFGRLHICPHCSEPFIPERRDQNYCSVAHREAHRVARWRSRKKQQAIGKREKNVTRQTR